MAINIVFLISSGLFCWHFVLGVIVGPALAFIVATLSKKNCSKSVVLGVNAYFVFTGYCNSRLQVEGNATSSTLHADQKR